MLGGFGVAKGPFKGLVGLGGLGLIGLYEL